MSEAREVLESEGLELILKHKGILLGADFRLFSLPFAD